MKFSETARKLANTLSWIGLILLVTGGFTFRHALSGKSATIEVSQWGYFFLPLFFLVVTNRGNWRDLPFVTSMYRIWPAFGGRPMTWSLALGIPFLHLLAMLHRHYSFNSGWDLAIYANACANDMQSSFRNQTSLLADHFEPILLLFTSFCSRFNPVAVLFFALVCFWSIGSLGIRKLALRAGWSASLANLSMLVYLLFTGNQTTSYIDFHPYAFALGTIPWLWYCILERKYALSFLIALVHLSLKENSSLFIAGLGFFLLVTSDQKKIGFAFLALGFLSFLVIMKYVFPLYRSGNESEYFVKYYGYLGSTLSEFIKTCLLKPWIPLKEFFRPEKLQYLFLILAPFSFIHLLSPKFLIPVLSAIAISILSSVPSMYSTNFHYEAEIYPWLFASAFTVISSPDRLLDRIKNRIPINLPTLFLGVLIVFFTGTTPLARIAYYSPTKTQIEFAAKLHPLITDLKDCIVATNERLAPHLAAIPDVRLLDQQQNANAIVIAYPRGDSHWIQTLDMIEKGYVPTWNQNYTLETPLDHDKDFRVWRKLPCK